ncbi:PREDICTED: endoglucanase 4-like [Ipomoea nil]|uniref:endoglucanase 4-like n=1 Tax=Ipomoea nil TaxID=35883 RepID=UPI000901120B|nr:PREDICTED: endoglucanase 4-like [Ipomoea nil]
MAALVKVAAAFLCLITIVTAAEMTGSRRGNDYGDALSKSILFFEGQRSGKLPSNQRLNWRRDSALQDGSDHGVDLTGGYYDAGDNVKYSFPMAFSTTMLAWSVVEYGGAMGDELGHALEAVRWATDFMLKATDKPNVVYAMVGEPHADHSCWERPEDMDTPRTSFAVTDTSPGSEVSAEIAAAMAAASLAFKSSDRRYSKLLLKRATQVFQFADKYRGSYNTGLGQWVCPFYCDFGGYQDELVWAAAWLHKATNDAQYWNYVKQNINGMSMATSMFGWDSKHAGINVLVSQFILTKDSPDFNPFIPNADALVCNVLPESPFKSEKFSPGGLMVQDGAACNMQRPAAVSFLFVTYGTYLEKAKRTINCGNVVVTPARLIEFAKSQVDYILGNNPIQMSYMVGYGFKYPQRAHHRGASLPSVGDHGEPMGCDGWSYLQTQNPNPNLLVGAVVGGPDGNDQFADDRNDPNHSEPTTYVNAPLVGILAYFKAH